jgi:hypothetical protein
MELLHGLPFTTSPRDQRSRLKRTFSPLEMATGAPFRPAAEHAHPLTGRQAERPKIYQRDVIGGPRVGRISETGEEGPSTDRQASRGSESK